MCSVRPTSSSTSRARSSCWRDDMPASRNGKRTLSSTVRDVSRLKCWNTMPTDCRYCRSRAGDSRSEEHTSELQSRGHLVCRLLLEKKKTASQQDDDALRQ